MIDILRRIIFRKRFRAAMERHPAGKHRES